MKLIILKDKFKEGLMIVERGVVDSGNLPILRNVLIRTYNNKIKLSTTNLEIGVTCFVFGKINKEGGITLPFKTLYQIIQNLDTERVVLETEGNVCFIKTDSYEAKIQGIGIDEFPIIPKINNETVFISFKIPIFRSAIEQIINAAQISEIRPEISGILFDYQIQSIKLTATDTFRLAEKSIGKNLFESKINQGIKIIIPLKTISEVLRIFPADGEIKVFIDPNQILFINENRELISRLIDGEYPDYEAIIPRIIETEIIVPKEQWINSLKLVSNFSGRVHEVKIKFINDKKSIQLYAANQIIGENSYIIPVKSKGGDFNEIAFNWRYLLDGLRAVEGNDVFFGVNGSNKPSIIKKPNDASFFYIIMPIRS